jgi:D-aminoacyl-tRNA deacylase
MRLIVTSQKDVAGSNIYKFLVSNGGFKKIGWFEDKPIYQKGSVQLIATKKGQVESEHLDEHFSPDYYVFASRHRSASNERTLTVHAPGNLTDQAQVGGRPREIAYTAPDAMKTALRMLYRAKMDGGLDYKVSFEVTHHGPTSLKRPVLFVEVGSTEKEWNDPLAVAAVANAAVSAAESTEKFEKGIGIGGNHYAPRHTRFVLDSEASLGHLIPSYALDEVDQSIYEEAVEKSSATFCFLDWKGMKKNQRKTVLNIVSELGLEVRRSISSDKLDVPNDYSVYRVCEDLFLMAERIDPSRLRETFFENEAVPFERNGHLVPEFAAASDIRIRILESCLEILEFKKPKIEGEKLILQEQKFDPRKAAELGLKPGPDFSRIKKRGSLYVGNRNISYEEVVATKKIAIGLDSETLRMLKRLNL